MLIAHISDTHDRHRVIDQVGDCDVDLIIITGDCLNNVGRIDGRIDFHREVRYQLSWGTRQAKHWAAAIRKRPVIAVRGNHDFIPYASILGYRGVNIMEITNSSPSCVIDGVTFAGFHQVPWYIGEWSGEENDLTPHVERAFNCNPDILVTHVPPAGILDTGSLGESCGSTALTSMLMFGQHNVKHHFFGHAHGDGGQMLEQGGVTFYNGATHCIVHDVPLGAVDTVTP